MRALITGGQQGIGLGIAQALLAAGFEIAVAAEVADPDLTALPGARYFRHDLRDIGAVPALLAAVGPVETFVSNAGVAPPVRADVLDLGPDSFDHVLSVNLRGAFFLAQGVARTMIGQTMTGQPMTGQATKRQAMTGQSMTGQAMTGQAMTGQAGYRSMIFITSVSAGMASLERAEYCMSKAAASMMVKTFALRLAGAGIGVFELRPGIIDTAMTAGVRGKYDTAIAGGLVPAGRWGVPADVGAAVVPLALGQMAFATGSVITVDGGLSDPRL